MTCGREPYYDDRAPPSGPRPARNFRVKGHSCDGCGAAVGEVHDVNCPGTENYRGGLRG